MRIGDKRQITNNQPSINRHTSYAKRNNIRASSMSAAMGITGYDVTMRPFYGS